MKPSKNEWWQNKTKYITLNSIRLAFAQKTSVPNPAETLEYIKCYNFRSLRRVKSPSNSIRYNCQKACSWTRKPETILKIRKRPCFSRLSTSWLITSFLKILLTTERRLTGWQISAVELSLVFLITGTTDEIFQQSGKQDSLTHILKSSASMYESSDLQFFRTTSAIQYRRDVFHKSSWLWPSYPTWRLRVYYAVSY